MVTVLNDKIVCSNSGCNSTWFIQEHHISYDPEITENICVICHAKKHPDKYYLILASALRTRNRSRWNIPLHILALRAGVQPGAIVLRAQRHNILGGVLSLEEEALLSKPSRYKRRTTKEEKLGSKFQHLVDTFGGLPKRRFRPVITGKLEKIVVRNIEVVRQILKNENPGSSGMAFCRQCGFIWKKKLQHPEHCSRCGSYNWDKRGGS